MSVVEIVRAFSVVLAIGLVAGLERERHAMAEGRPMFGGARTYPLIALLGAASGLLATAWSWWIVVPTLFALAGLVGAQYVREAGADRDVGLTSEVAALFLFVIALIPFAPLPDTSRLDALLLTAGLGAILLALLAMSQVLHAFAGQLSAEDVRATVSFSLIAAVALPLLPDVSMGPGGALNPFWIGVVVVLIAAVGFAGYVAVRLWGARRGMAVTALAGGLVSSTAVTLTFSGKGRDAPSLAPACALAVGLACVTMLPRMLVEVAAIRRALLMPALYPIGAMLVAGAIGLWALWRRAEETPEETEPTLRNPFRLTQAVQLGVAYALVRVIAALAHDWFGDGGLYVTSVLAGLTDVDAITISVARMHAQSALSDHTAVMAITLAATSNTVVKAGLALSLGGRAVGLPVLAVLGPAAVIGPVVALLV